MTKIVIRKDQNGAYRQVICSGHAGYANAGKDIVCAAVSSIVITTINALLKLDKDSVSYKNSLEITIHKHNEVIDILIGNMLDMLKELEKDYKKYIKVEI